MNSFGPQSFTTAIKKLVPKNSKFKKEAITLITSLIYEINNGFVNACLENNVNAKDINVKHIRESIKSIIPGELRKYAFAEADSSIVKFHSGLIDYKKPEIEKEIGLDTRVLRKCLEQITQVVNSELTLSKDCTVFVSIMQKMAMQMAEKAIETIGDKPEMSLEDLRNIISSLLGEEMFQHSEGHAESNLEWYKTDDLDFTIKPLITEVGETESEDEINFIGKCVQKAFKSKYSTPTSKEVIQCFEKILNDLINGILEETQLVFQYGIDNVSNDSVSEEHVVEALRTLLPEPLFKFALCCAQAKLLNYRCGIIKYNYERKEEEKSVSKEEKAHNGNVLDFRKGVKYIMNMATCPYFKGFLPFMNDVLNDISSAIVERSVEAARGNDNVLSENNIIDTVHYMLPIQLREHAIARISHIQRELGQPCIQLGQVPSNVIKPTELKDEDYRNAKPTTENHRQLSNSLDDNKNYSKLSEHASLKKHFPSNSQTGGIANTQQRPQSIHLNTAGQKEIQEIFLEPRGSNNVKSKSEESTKGDFPEPRESNSVEKNLEVLNLETSKSDSFEIPSDQKSMENDNNTLPISVSSESVDQSEYQTSNGEDLGKKSELESKTSSSVELEAISSKVFQMENQEEDRENMSQNTPIEKSEYSIMPQENSDSITKDFLFNIQRNVYWLDVRPYEI